jgi:hypothetical protein
MDQPMAQEPVQLGFSPHGSRPWPTNPDGSPTNTGRIIRGLWGAGILIALIAAALFARA